MSGIEALGIAASIIQVADLGTKLSIQTFSFYRRVKNANEFVQLLSNEIALVSAILRELGDNLKEEESCKLCSDEVLRTLGSVMHQCRDVFKQIQNMIGNNEQPEKSRFQQVTGKFRLVVLEPSLDRLRTKLERLKSTMLLLLNVILYAGQIRSNNVPNLLLEQRGLIQILLEDKRNDSHKPRQPDVATEASQSLLTETTSRDSAHVGTDRFTNQQKHPNSHQPSFKEQTSEWQFKSTNESEAQIGIHRAMKRNEPTDLKEYKNLIQSMLHEIDSSRSKLKESRHVRIKDGV
ncbi:hypothetical protein N7462_005026 [Penicillium macrosclerotiorum]|uniref:uncharacterized protein n=1 Tax=Penicillium macrosclerotiorum TaxID=303699 RepID=UPI002547D5AD|nr:uncharacterized protein N7462_005026 [Penicillium macrosclerotiorum]KAJ5690634.1 hypothetical protein N7462_005026 [Penicillium macrosclerotiorum]